MSIRKFKNMYFRGTIESAGDFPALADRRDGYVYALWYDGTIGDPEVPTVVTPTPQVVTSIITNEGHQDPEEAGYKKITGVDSLFDTNLDVGAMIFLNGEIRFVEAIASETEITLNAPLNTEIALTDAVVVYRFINIVSATKLLYVDEDHATNKKVYGVGTAFLTDLCPGDEIYLVVDGRAMKRTVDAIADDDELTITTPLVGDLTSIEEENVYYETVPYVKYSTASQITGTNKGKYIMWNETPTGYVWTVIVNPA